MMENNKTQKPALSQTDVSGSFVKERYIKCPHKEKNCKWKMGTNHRKGHEYLNESCYLAGSFDLECP
jgi:hypothetical protein